MPYTYSAYPGKDTDVVAVLRDGRVIAYGCYQLAVLATTDTLMQITLPDLKRIEYVMEIEFHTQPATYFTKTQNKWITGNVVNLTIYAAAATTVTADVLAIGPP